MYYSVRKSCPALCNTMNWSTQVPLSSTISMCLLKFISIESVMLYNHLILCHPLLFPSIFPSIRVFCNESVLCIRWPKYWRFSFSISPSNQYSGLIPLGLTVVWSPCCPRDSGESSPAAQFESINSWDAAFFMVQLSHPCMTTGKIYIFTFSILRFFIDRFCFSGWILTNKATILYEAFLAPWYTL